MGSSKNKANLQVKQSGGWRACVGEFKITEPLKWSGHIYKYARSIGL